MDLTGSIDLFLIKFFGLNDFCRNIYMILLPYTEFQIIFPKFLSLFPLIPGHGILEYRLCFQILAKL